MMERKPQRPPAGRVAVVHEWVASRAGSEKVFERLAHALPASADLYALAADPDVAIETSGRPIKTTALDQSLLRDRRAALLPLMPAAWKRAASAAKYETIVTSSHAFAREFAHAQPDATHLCYVHSPMRYAWEREVDPRTNRRWTAAPAAVLRRVDLRSVATVDSFAANSVETRDRIRRHYGADAEIINPPVNTEFYSRANRSPAGYLLAFGRFIEYKRFDLAIAVAEQVKLPLRIAGWGPLESQLRELAGHSSAHVTFDIRPSDERLLELLSGADALLFPGLEDFGIVPVEAQAAGVPVIGPRLGGLCDTVIDGETGVLVEDQSVDALSDGVRRALGETLGGRECRRNAERFRPEEFDRRVREWVGAYVDLSAPDATR